MVGRVDSMMLTVWVLFVFCVCDLCVADSRPVRLEAVQPSPNGLWITADAPQCSFSELQLSPPFVQHPTTPLHLWVLAPGPIQVNFWCLCPECPQNFMCDLNPHHWLLCLGPWPHSCFECSKPILTSRIWHSLFFLAKHLSVSPSHTHSCIHASMHIHKHTHTCMYTTPILSKWLLRMKILLPAWL